MSLCAAFLPLADHLGYEFAELIALFAGLLGTAPGIAAARAGLLRVANRNAAGEGEVGFEVGIALHFGNAAYGNVGSGARLDYTVIGRDVNLASRLADLCGKLDQRLLLSNSFQSRLSEHELKNLGAFSLKGVDQAQTVFAPVEL